MTRCGKATAVNVLRGLVPPAVFHKRVHESGLNSGKRLIFQIFSDIARDRPRIWIGGRKKGVDRFQNCHV